MEKTLFEKVNIGGLTLRNRMVRSATWLGLAEPDGTLPGEVFETYREVAAGGIGTSVAGVRAGRGEAYFLPFAARLAREVPVPVILVGGLRSRAAMQRVLDETDIALLSLSRPLLREPDWPEALRRGLSDSSRCISCNRCYSTPGHRCAFRAAWGGSRRTATATRRSPSKPPPRVAKTRDGSRLPNSESRSAIEAGRALSAALSRFPVGTAPRAVRRV